MVDPRIREDRALARRALEPAVIYEDSDMFAVNKPAGLLTHGTGRGEQPTLADWALERDPQLVAVGEPMRLTDGRTIARPGIVHRLDAETSGVVVIAKTAPAFEHLKHQFLTRQVEKVYNAFLFGVPRKRSGTIERPIGRSRSDFRKYSAERGARGKLREALTEYRVLEAAGGYSFVEVRPKTGRTHQIRVHFKAIGHPVVCDQRYASTRVCALGFTRLALHAWSLSFIALSGARLTLEASIPEDFERALTLLSAMSVS